MGSSGLDDLKSSSSRQQEQERPRHKLYVSRFFLKWTRPHQPENRAGVGVPKALVGWGAVDPFEFSWGVELSSWGVKIAKKLLKIAKICTL